MYLCGGTDSTKTKLSKKAYHFSMDSGVIKEHPVMKEGRHSFPLAYDGQYLYAIGGVTEKGFLKTVERVNTKDLKAPWESVGELPEERGYSTAFFTNSKIYVIGGANASGDLKSICTMDVKTLKWEVLSKFITSIRF
jgi:hypothetical protein